MLSVNRCRDVVLALMCVAMSAAASAQTLETWNYSRPYGLDPYNPTHAAILRNYGAALITPRPLTEVAAMDPFSPTEAGLLRQLGGAIPMWFVWYGAGPVAGVPAAQLARPTAPSTPGATAPGQQVAESTAAATAIATLERPAVNDGVSIRYNGRTWVNAGRAVPVQSARFTRIGVYGGSPVYRRADEADDVIFISTTSGFVAPFRARPN